MKTMLTLSGLTFGYSKRNPLFEDLNLQVTPGHIYGLFGQNGTGKTTLLKQMVGALFPWQGTVTVFGYPAQGRFPEVLQDIFLIPENFAFPSLSLQDYVNLHSPFYPRFDHEQLQRHVAEFDVDLDQKLPKLSFGQQKKALLAFAMATNARLLIMDEPTNGLDIPSKSQFRKSLAASVSDDQAVFISTHQVRDLANLIDQVIILNDGQIIFHHSVTDIANNLAFRKIEEEAEKSAIYAEPAFTGYNAIVPQNGEETEVDLELLFNGVIKQPESIHQHFKKAES